MHGHHHHNRRESGWDGSWGGGWGGQVGGPGFGPERGGRRGPRARRGDVRAAILDVLAGDEMNGYQLIQQISERTGGGWKPSPGSVYPTVQQLEDEGLVDGRDLMPIVGQVMGGMWQIVTTGTAQQRAEAAEILTETRRRLYQLLADGD